MGDGVKARLDNTPLMAIRHYQQYCDDNFPDGELKAMTLKTAKATRVFRSKLGTHIDNKYSMLTSFKLITKHILLLLLNQVIQICKNVIEPRCTASNVDVANNKGAAAAWFAWVTLQAHRMMQGFLKDKFKYHQTISGCFVRFLMWHMAHQLALGLKTNVDKLKMAVKDLKAGATNRVSTEMFNKFDSKLQNLIHLNPNLKTRD
jgi:hypothetical protein